MPGSRAVRLVVLVILDGWGCAAAGPGNAVELADTPVFDRLWRTYPHTRLLASGEAVGLPPGQMGNSEVGHLTIGSGRVLDQDFQRVNRSIANGSFFENDALVSAFRRARERGGDVHLLGLVSYGGVHSHIDHLRALLELARREDMADRTWIHAFTDGRDVSPTSAVHDLAELPDDRIASVSGRYYAMDRDKRWERTELALKAILQLDIQMAMATSPSTAITAVRRSYDDDVTDEFIVPVWFEGRPGLDPAKDAAIFFNFRPDRGRQLSEKLGALETDLTTMTKYREDFDFPVAFPEQTVDMVLAEVLAEHGVRQLHTAETEKYAHVTYFFNGGREDEFAGETRVLVPSPRDVPSYDLKPQMSAVELTDRFVEEIGSGDYAFAVINFANPDMVGHTGSIPAVVAAVETTDRCLGRVVEAVRAERGICLVTADHGNAERMLEDDGVHPHTAHTTNPVPLIVTENGHILREDGELSDLAPTVLALLGFAQPLQMTGRNLSDRS
ncbi:MAG TPA: 2,3-bisphosphoglycerate-independent phosphoglycerate mutase [Gaiellaceae bacterium]|nr:2,3-bisphosphoglycerate-independent phosphoglycerate mutase [Gaiellaceae bacterium]